MAKQVISDIVQTTSEVEFGLMRYPQVEGSAINDGTDREHRGGLEVVVVQLSGLRSSGQPSQPPGCGGDGVHRPAPAPAFSSPTSSRASRR